MMRCFSKIGSLGSNLLQLSSHGQCFLGLLGIDTLLICGIVLLVNSRQRSMSYTIDSTYLPDVVPT
jgi:hypothetical protein